MALDSIIEQGVGPIAAELPNGRLAMISLENRERYATDPVGGRIWQLIGRRRPVSEVVDALETEFAVERPRLEADVLAFLNRALDRGLVRLVES